MQRLDELLSLCDALASNIPCNAASLSRFINVVRVLASISISLRFGVNISLESGKKTQIKRSADLKPET